jgi:serine/threonine protein kinase
MAPFSKVKFGPKASLNYYKIGRVIGKGGFGKVNLALHKLTKKLCAVKSINMNKGKQESAMKKLENEIFLLRYLRHPSIIKLYETVDAAKFIPQNNSSRREEIARNDRAKGRPPLNYHLFFMELC